MFGDPIVRSVETLNKIKCRKEKETIPELPASLKPYPPARVISNKIVHRPQSFAHQSVKVGMSPKFSHLPECELKKRDAQRNAADTLRGHIIPPELHPDANIMRGKIDPWSLPVAGSPGNLASGYGNNRKMFNNVRLNGD